MPVVSALEAVVVLHRMPAQQSLLVATLCVEIASPSLSKVSC